MELFKKATNSLAIMEGARNIKDTTSSMPISHAYEKCLLGLASMVRSPESLQSRLRDAFMNHMMHIDVEDDLTPALRVKFDELKSILTAREGKKGELRLEATTRKMTVEDAQAAAEIFIGFASMVTATFHARKNNG